MRIGLLIGDTEYRNALVEKLSSNDNDIFVNILDGTNQGSSDCLILTDASPENLDLKTFEKIGDRTVFLCNTYDNNSSDKAMEGCNRIFKYLPINEMISELSLVYDDWHGSGLKRNYSSRTIAVICESDLYASDRCKALARQIIYRHGGRVLVFSLSYLNDYGCKDMDGINRFARLMYEARSGRLTSLDKHTYSDAYGVSYLMLSPGQNPAAYLEKEELNVLVSGLSLNYDILILDIATCFRRENIHLLKSSDNIIFFKSGRRHIDVSHITGKETISKIRAIKLGGDSDEAMEIDDCVRDIFGINTDEYKS